MLKSSQIPGDDTRILTSAATSSAGVRYPAGTTYVPLASGIDNRLPRAPWYQTVLLGGERVTFHFPR